MTLVRIITTEEFLQTIKQKIVLITNKLIKNFKQK